jgi:hypothetical protein
LGPLTQWPLTQSSAESHFAPFPLFEGSPAPVVLDDVSLVLEAIPEVLVFPMAPPPPVDVVALGLASSSKPRTCAHDVDASANTRNMWRFGECMFRPPNASSPDGTSRKRAQRMDASLFVKLSELARVSVAHAITQAGSCSRGAGKSVAS